jgi:adenylylsulfate kinase-like enzyme
MIIVLFGQPHCGKSTLARKLVDDQTWNIDGDDLRNLFKNKNYTREGRLQNLNRASDIAHYMESLGTDIVLSLIYPYRDARNYLNSLNDNVKWIHLTYEGKRGREDFHVKDFEYPIGERILHLDTSKLSITECVDAIKSYINEELPSPGTE